MEFSSEESFVWTDTSSDGSSMILNDNNMSVKDEPMKRFKKEQDMSGDDLHEQDCDTVVKREEDTSKKRKRIKEEPESDYDKPKKKKKKKQVDVNGFDDTAEEISANNNVSLDHNNMKVEHEDKHLSTKKARKEKKHSVSCNDNYTDEKYKEEDNTVLSLKQSKKNRKGSNVLETSNSFCVDTYPQEEIKGEDIVKQAKKKRKHSSTVESDHSISSTIPNKQKHNNMVEDNVDTDSEAVHKDTKTKKKKSKHKHIKETSPHDLSENDQVDTSVKVTKSAKSFELDSEESDCNEISAIRGDDDHNLHSTLFANNTISTYDNCNESVVEKGPEEQGLRKPRISDRIVFEDDDTTEKTQIDNSTNKHIATSKKIKHYIKKHSNLKQISREFNDNIVLRPEDNIWILKCPRHIDAEAFKNVTLNTQGKNKIKLNGQTYESFASEEAPDSAVVLTMNNNQLALRNIPLMGVIQTRRRIPKPHVRDDNIMVNSQTNFIPLPETKCRHPLFGPNYKRAVKIPKAIAERLNAHENSNFDVVTHKKKKHKKDKVPPDDIQCITKHESTIEVKPEPGSEGKEKKKKKRKLDNDDSGDAPSSKRAKRIKHDPDAPEAWDSERAIEQNLFNF